MIEYFKYNLFIFFFAFFLTLIISYLEGYILHIRKPNWAHLKNSLTTALISVLCVYLYKMNEWNTELEIFQGEMNT